jgi:uncharacterized protein YbcI
MPEHAAQPSQGHLQRELADTVVRVLREITGRGATRARAIINDDVAMVVLYDTLTTGERMLVSRGQEAEVLAFRHAFQRAMTEEVTAAVQVLLGRRVVAFMSTNHVDPDCSCEIFILGDAVPAVAPFAA